MLKLIMITLIAWLPLSLKAKTIKVAVVDTGFDFKATWQPSSTDLPGKPTLCPTGHKDFTGEGLNDSNGHGTHVAGLIGHHAGKSDYCLVVYKFYSDSASDFQNLVRSTRAIKAAIDEKVDIINYSGGGTSKSETECKVFKQALDQGIRVVAAAGNESSNLKYNKYYPALCDSRIVVVENINKNNELDPTSNYSTTVEIKTVKEVGVKLYSIAPNGQYKQLTGTSQSAAVRTGKIVNKLNKNKKLDSYSTTKLLKSAVEVLAQEMHIK